MLYLAAVRYSDTQLFALVYLPSVFCSMLRYAELLSHSAVQSDTQLIILVPFFFPGASLCAMCVLQCVIGAAVCYSDAQLFTQSPLFVL